MGAVALPGLGLTLTSGSPKPLAPANVPLRMLVSRTRPAAEAVYVAEKMGAGLLAMGSAGAKAMAVVLGQADIYLHTGGGPSVFANLDAFAQLVDSQEHLF